LFVIWNTKLILEMKPLRIDNPYRSEENRRFANRCRLLVMGKEIEGWYYEPFTFNIGDGATYTPDFLLVYSDKFVVVEVKGSTRTRKQRKVKAFAREDDIIKLKVLKRFMPYFQVLLAWEDGIDNWQFREF